MNYISLHGVKTVKYGVFIFQTISTRRHLLPLGFIFGFQFLFLCQKCRLLTKSDDKIIITLFWSYFPCTFAVVIIIFHTQPFHFRKLFYLHLRVPKFMRKIVLKLNKPMDRKKSLLVFVCLQNSHPDVLEVWMSLGFRTSVARTQWRMVLWTVSLVVSWSPVTCSFTNRERGESEEVVSGF